jgi:hypothetical protein
MNRQRILTTSIIFLLTICSLTLAAFSWATYRRKTDAAKITCVLDWVKGVPRCSPDSNLQSYWPHASSTSGSGCIT